METKDPPKIRERLVVEIDYRIIRRLRHERAETSRPVNHIVEEVLARHYETIPPIVTQ